ncbi:MULTISPECIES: RidA family protein [unclassified Chelatococcus]|uniref:RidA family protein n=1 Tax=unclassified Chelatococcus TaxID=2638111 RepID=UPI001BCE68D6|nr:MULTISPECIES: RidA family protein [unclassified Chelatococcus]CAH1649583.1 putative RutC family protein HI_1627 [Hyphomicrobiales bacterium]MBS7741744.1 RidA family protein [Chelatococcus sp. HY11]MBX3541458.1 RidA family protein [Chelatococcus sp.]MCO5074648.1 RidA family protein [Chelatococcus sp.]CAH1692053.1 putative RutC family protein HI_1627 [Hyphomicrobiales bacterium]
MTAKSDISSLIQHFGVGARASIAVTHNGVGYFAVTPQAPYDGTLPAADQARQLFAKADSRLAEIGSGKDKLLFVAIIVADMNDKDAVNAVWDAWVSDVTPPARACFEARLASPDLKVEMIMLCAADQGAA